MQRYHTLPPSQHPDGLISTLTLRTSNAPDALVLRILDAAASRRPIGLFDPQHLGARTTHAARRELLASAFQRALEPERAARGMGLRSPAAETVIVEESGLPPAGDAPPQPDPPDDPEFEAIPIPGTDEAIFVPKYSFRLVDPRTRKVLGGRWREGDKFRDKDANRTKKPDSMEPGNVGDMNPNGVWILLERIF